MLPNYRYRPPTTSARRGERHRRGRRHCTPRLHFISQRLKMITTKRTRNQQNANALREKFSTPAIKRKAFEMRHTYTPSGTNESGTRATATAIMAIVLVGVGVAWAADVRAQHPHPSPPPPSPPVAAAAQQMQPQQQAELDALRRLIEDLRQQQTAAAAVMARMQAELDGLRRKVDELRAENAALRAENAILKQRMAENMPLPPQPQPPPPGQSAGYPLAFSVGGRVAEAMAAAGEVEAGQMIARLDDTEPRLAREMAAAEMRIHEAELHIARSDATLSEQEIQVAQQRLQEAERELHRIEMLAEQGSASTSAVTEARLKLATARQESARTARDRDARAARMAAMEAKLRIAQIRVAAAEQRLAATVLRAPSAGTVAKIGAAAGMIVTPGQPVAHFVPRR